MIYHYKCNRCDHLQESNDPPRIIHICEDCGHVDIPLEYIDLSCVHVAYNLTILQQEQERRQHKQEVSRLYKWKQKDGTYINLHDMNDTHLANAIKMIKRLIERHEYL